MLANVDEFDVTPSSSPIRSPHELATRKRTIDAQLEVDRQNLQALKDSLSKGSTLSDNMVTCLNSFEGRLGRLQTAVLPIYENTVTLTKKLENVQAVLKNIADVVNFFDLTDSAKAIKKGVHQFGDIDAYMVCVEHTIAARDFFKAEKPDSLDHNNAADLSTTGTEKLCELFRNRCRTVSKAYTDEAMSTLRDTSLPETRIEDTALAQFPEDVQTVMTNIIRWLHDKATDDSGFIAYSKLRSTVVECSLASYRPRVPSVLSVTSSTAKSTRVKSSEKGAKSKFLKVAGGKDSNRSSPANKGVDDDVISADVASVQSLSVDMTRKRPASSLSVQMTLDDIVAYYCLYCLTYVQILRVEKALIREMMPEANQKITFDKLLAPSMDVLVSDGESVAVHVKAALGEHKFMGVIGIMRCAKLFFDMSPQFVALFKGLPSDPAARIVTLRNFFQTKMYEGLQEMLEYGASVATEKLTSSAASLPSDGTVHEITSSTVQILKKMCEYQDVLGHVLVKFEPNQHIDSISPVLKACGNFFSRVMHSINNAVEQKGRCYESDTLQAIFKLNNYTYMRKHCDPSSPLFKIVTESWPAVQEEYNNLIVQQEKLYRQGFSKLISLLGDVSLADKPASDASKVVKTAIKEKFKNVNAELEELHRVQQRYSVPDDALRAQLIAKNSEMILPKYETFLERHSAVQTFKTPYKYLKYSAKECGMLLSSFFDQSA